MRGGGDRGNEVMDRAIRRLGVLEALFLLMAAGAALVAGALVAWLLVQALGLPFRPTWAAASLILFILPGGISLWRVRRADAARRRTAHDPERDDR